MILLCPLSKEWFAPFVELFNGSFSVFQMIHFFCRWSWFQLQLSVMKMHRFNSQYIVNSWIGAGSIECNRRGSPLKNRPSNAGENAATPRYRVFIVSWQIELFGPTVMDGWQGRQCFLSWKNVTWTFDWHQIQSCCVKLICDICVTKRMQFPPP